MAAEAVQPECQGALGAQGPGRESWSFFHKYEFSRTFLKGLSLTQSWVFRDSRRPTVPGFTRHDVGATYRFTALGQRLTLGLRVQNLRDIQYWEGFQARGAPRTTSVTVSSRF